VECLENEIESGSVTMLSMNMEGYLHIRVPTQIELNLTDSQIKQNSVEGTVKTISKPDQEAINREMSKVGLNLNNMGNEDVDFGSIGSRMVGGGVGQCFDNLNQTLPQIAKLAPTKDSDEEEEEEEAEAEGKKPETGGQPKGKNQKKAGEKEKEAEEESPENKEKWWAREDFVSDKHHELEKLVEDATKEGIEQKMAIQFLLLDIIDLHVCVRFCLDEFA
jgi:hypothetical protein